MAVEILWDLELSLILGGAGEEISRFMCSVDGSEEDLTRIGFGNDFRPFCVVSSSVMRITSEIGMDNSIWEN